MSVENHLQNLRHLLGDQGVLSAPEDLSAYEGGARGDRGKAAFALRPADTDAVSKAAAYCARHSIALIPQSGNTGLVGASVPDESGTQAVMSLERMRDIFDIDAANRSAHIGAGVRLSALNAALEEHGLFFPVDLSADPCIGGMVSTNTGGSRLMRYGGVRENTLGLKVVLVDEDGTVLDVLCPLHKNNTGLDLKHIFIGTGGTFGIVTEAVVKLAPLPRQSATALLVPSRDEDVVFLLGEIEAYCGALLSAFEGMSGEAMRRALAHAPSLSNPFGQDDIPDYALLIELSRSWEPRESEQSLDSILELMLEDLWGRDHSPLADAVLVPPDKLWALRHALSEGVQKSGKLYAFDISFKRGDAMRFRAQMLEDLPRLYPDVAICDFGHIGDGGMHFNLVIPKNDPRGNDPDFEEDLRDWVYARVVEDFNGSFSAEHGLGRKNQRYFERYTSEEIKALSRGIRDLMVTGRIGAWKL